MNPRYLAYCRAHGKTPDEMLALDRERWPGGVMCGFMLWMSAQWRAFMNERHPGVRGFDYEWFKNIAAEPGGAFDQWQRRS